jgi:NAD-dependent deacetylase
MDNQNDTRKKLVVFSGAGISAESGLSTFRDSGGLWERHDVRDVASIDGWRRDPKLVLDFYNERRRQLEQAEPNAAHEILAELERDLDVTIITQNVDNLHERAGSTQVTHLHGELTKACSSLDLGEVRDIGYRPIALGETCSRGAQLRPFIVWFGEPVPLIDTARDLVRGADFFAVIGTSLNVYPAAGLINMVDPHTCVFVIDPRADEMVLPPLPNQFTLIPKTASEGTEQMQQLLFRL